MGGARLRSTLTLEQAQGHVRKHPKELWDLPLPTSACWLAVRHSHLKAISENAFGRIRRMESLGLP